MAYFQCDAGKRYQIFGKGGGQDEAKRMKIPFLAEIPIDSTTCEAGDYGAPIALANPKNSIVSQAFKDAAESLQKRVLA